MRINENFKYILYLLITFVTIIVFITNNKYHSKNVKVPILMYHEVTSNPHSGGLGLRVPVNKFNWQIKYLHSHGFHSVSLNDVMNNFKFGIKLPSKPIVITFDDGYENNYTYALPILKKYKFKATVFLVYNTLNKTNTFDKQFHQPRIRMLKDWQVRKLISNNIEVGSHTLNHPILTKIKPITAKKEIRNSKIALEKRFGIHIRIFCYPHGKYNSRLKELVKQAGYACAVTTRQGVSNIHSDIYLLKRVRIMGKYSNSKFVHKINKFLY